MVHDYHHKPVESADLVLPADAPIWASDRAALWNAAEQAETRKNSTVAREFEIALPAELSPEERRRLAVEFAREIVGRHGCAADVAIHPPGQASDSLNHHAHILVSTRRLTPDGFTEKTRELDERKTGEVERWRERFAYLQNERLREAGAQARVDHRTLDAQGIDREPTQHLGPAVAGMERRGKSSEVGRRLAEEANARLFAFAARETGRIERELAEVDRSILDLSGDLAKAKAERDRRPSPESLQRGKALARQAYERRKAERAEEQARQEAEQRLQAERQRAESERQRERQAPLPSHTRKRDRYLGR